MEVSIMRKNSSRNYKEFIKDDKAIREDATKLQQKGGGDIDHNIERDLEDKVHAYDRNIKKQSEPEVTVEPENKEAIHRVKELNKNSKDYEALRAARKEAYRDGMEHDMRDQALGQIYKVHGAEVDFDEIDKMVRNNIRDVGELVDESLQNDGYNENIEEIESIIHDGDLHEIVGLNQKYDMKDIANAYVNVVKESGPKDASRLDKISEICEFEHPSYEKIFDNIRENDPVADKVLDKLEEAIGRER